MFRWTHVRTSAVALTLALALGCGAEYPTTAADAGKGITSGTPLAEIEAVLGEPHPPTPTQAKQIEGVMAKMPPAVWGNAGRDKSLAW